MRLTLVLCLCAVALGAELFTLDQVGLIPEGVEYYAPHGFLVSSIGSGQVYSFDPVTESLSLFSNTPRLISSIGLQVDTRTDQLYAINSIDLTHMSIVALSLRDGSFVREYDVSSLGQAGQRKFGNDVSASDKQGNIYATESAGGYVFRINLNTGVSDVFASGPELQPTDVYFDATTGVGANGIALWKNDYLLVSRFSNSSLDLYKIMLNDSTRTIRRVQLPSSPTSFPAFDGLYFRENGNLLGVAGQNVLEMQSSDNWASARVVKVYPVSKTNPTTVVEVDGGVFVLTASNFLPNVPYYIEQIDNTRVSFVNSDSSHSSVIQPALCMLALLSFLLI